MSVTLTLQEKTKIRGFLSELDEFTRPAGLADWNIRVQTYIIFLLMKYPELLQGAGQ